MYPKSLIALIESFQKLPGIGAKTAERLALHTLTSMTQEEVLKFSTSLQDALQTIHPCEKCHMLTDQSICHICEDNTRDNTLMIVADAKDVIALEHMKTYHGYYHVLGGLIDFSRGITDEHLHIHTLQPRLNHMKEVILATNSTMEGELTAKYLKALLESSNVLISRLAYGLPVGTDFKYADEKTLSKAVENRLKY
jgi:recombination protein RecR